MCNKERVVKLIEKFNLCEYNCAIHSFSNNEAIKHFRPTICPHCGNSISPSLRLYTTSTMNECILLLLVFMCPHPNCMKQFFCVYSQNKQEKHTYDLLTIYPSMKSKVFDPLVKQMSPKFVIQYNEAYDAEQLNHLDLASCGYRNALETLIKDFAIKYLNKSYEEVCSKKLYGAIEAYVPDLKSAADVVRILGNDKTHYEQKYDVDFEQLKYYMEIFEYLILAKLKMLNPPVSRD